MRLLSFLALSLFFTTGIKANSCPNVRMDKVGGSMENVGLRKQYLGTCYVYAAVAAWDALRFSIRDDDNNYVTHPLYASLLAKENSDISASNDLAFIETGNANSLLRKLRKNGSCVAPNNDFDMFLGLFKHGNKSEHREYLNELLKIFNEQEQLITDKENQERKAYFYSNAPKYETAQDNTYIYNPYTKLFTEDEEIKSAEEIYQEQIADIRKNFENKIIETEAKMVQYGYDVGVDSLQSRNIGEIYYSISTNSYSSATPVEHMKESLFGSCQKVEG